MTLRVDHQARRTRRPAAAERSEHRSGGASVVQCAARDPRSSRHRRLLALASSSPGVMQLQALQDLVDGGSAVQLKNGQKTTSDYLEDYDAELDLQEEIYQDQADELWSDLVDVWDFAMQQLANSNYTGWDATDSPVGANYTRFIWYFDYGVTLGANVHYTGGGKVAGHTYVKDVPGAQIDTPAQVVANAPGVRPGTTATW